jgi:hypothetical protein
MGYFMSCLSLTEQPATWLGFVHVPWTPFQLGVRVAQAIALLRSVEKAPNSHGPLNVATCSLPPLAVRPMRE